MLIGQICLLSILFWLSDTINSYFYEEESSLHMDETMSVAFIYT